MSGHSKWSTIKRQKGVADQKRGAAFTKLSNAITLAVKQGGGVADPSGNFKLRLAVDAAKTANMPKENIERAIKRASGKDAGELEEVIYEGFGPGGVSVIIEAATDNSLRTTSVVKSMFNKAGGSFGQPGSVAYQFNQVGEIFVKKEGKNFEQIFNDALEAGAEDIEDLEEEVIISTDLSELSNIKEELDKKGYQVTQAEIVRRPIVPVEVDDDEKLEKIRNFVDSIEEMDDVQKVYTNIA